MIEAPQPIARPIPALPTGWHPIRHAVLADGSLAVLGADQDLIAEFKYGPAGGLLGDPWGVAAKATAGVWTLKEGKLVSGPSFPLLTPFQTVERFPDGRWLVTGARAPEQGNARILAADGSEIGRLHLGDGIAQLKIDQDSRIWVGWFDEGVFGNSGWNVPGREWPPSSSGLAAFDEHGAVVVEAEPPSPDQFIVDCYAMNLASGIAYACPENDSPIVSVSVEKQAWRRTGLNSGFTALAVRFPYVLAMGGFLGQSNRAVLVRLDHEEGSSIREWRMPFKLGFPSEVSFVDGRDEAIHVVNDGFWFRWEIGDFLAELGL